MLANIAYVRVSTIEQNESRQMESLSTCGIDKIFKEKVSGKDTNRPELQAMLEYVREGDVVYVHDFSRLARSTKDLLDIIENLESRGIKLVSIKENMDTSTPQGKLMVTMLGAINEFERANILERQREGIEIAKKKGLYKGRKKIDRPDNWGEVYEKYLVREITGRKAMEILGVKKSLFYRWVREEKEKD